MRALASLVRAERAVETATTTALNAWMGAYLNLLIDGKAPSVRTPEALVAATAPDPSQSEQARPLWDALVASLVLPKLLDLYKTRLSQISAPFREPTYAAFEQRVTEFLHRAPDRFFALAQEIVGLGITNGASVTEMRAELRAELPNLVPSVAKNTGLALGGDVYNTATIDGYETLTILGGRSYVKSWLSCRDDRVRLTHAEADVDPANNKIPLQQKFVVGGSFADHPRDPALPLSEVMGCRCVVDIERA